MEELEEVSVNYCPHCGERELEEIETSVCKCFGCGLVFEINLDSPNLVHLTEEG